MEQKVRVDQIPCIPKTLYTKLYCERKGKKDKDTIQEARRSWMSLSDSDKTLFYKTTAKRKLLNYTHGLNKAKIYLKEKYPKNKEGCSMEIEQEVVTPRDESYSMENVTQCTEENNDKTEDNTDVEDISKTQIDNIERPTPELSPINHRNDSKLEVDAPHEINTETPLCNRSPLNEKDEPEDALETQSTVSSIQRSVPLAEPTPPTLNLGRDLYEILKRPEDVEWRGLIKRERNHYNAAVRTIKRDYIKNYTKYLESLSQQQLFDHYIKTLIN